MRGRNEVCIFIGDESGPVYVKKAKKGNYYIYKFSNDLNSIDEETPIITDKKPHKEIAGNIIDTTTSYCESGVLVSRLDRLVEARYGQTVIEKYYLDKSGSLVIEDFDQHGNMFGRAVCKKK